MTPEEQIKKVADEMGGLIKELRETHEQKLAAEIKGLGVGELKQMVEKMNDRFDTLEDSKKSLEDSLTKLNRKSFNDDSYTDAYGQKAERPADHDEVKAMFENFMRTGDIEGKSHKENKTEFRIPFKDGKKSMSVLSDPDGGFTVMTDLNGRMRTKIFETSPILSVCNIQTTGKGSLTGMIDDGEASSGWVGEISARTETDTPQIGEWSIPVQEVYAMPKATQNMLDDSEWDIERFLQDKATDNIARKINLACVSGIDPKQPRGFLTYAAGTDYRTQIEQVNLKGASDVTADGLIYLQESLKQAYRPNAKWAFRRSTRRNIRVLKDSYGQYLMQPGLVAGTPSTILEDPYIIFEDMPAIQAGALAVAYADWNEFYQAVERQGTRILRDPYTNKGYVLFYITRRFGGDVHNHEAGKLGKIAA